MRTRLVGVGAVMLVTFGAAAHAGELERLRDENARLQQQVRSLEADNARLRGQASAPPAPAPAASDNSGLAAALEQRANESVSVSPSAEPGASVVATEASRLEGLQGGRSRHWITWRAERQGGASRPDAALVVIDATASGGVYRDVKNLDLIVDGASVQCPVTDYRIDSMTVGRRVCATGWRERDRAGADGHARPSGQRPRISGRLGTTSSG